MKQLAKSKKHQEKLRQEMLKIRDKDGQFDYDSLTDNHFVEQVIYGKFFLCMFEFTSIFT